MRIVIVGGGVIGLSTAWAARRRGHEVVVVEQGLLPNPRGSSFGAHRLIRAPYGDLDGYAKLVLDAYTAWDLLWADLGVSLYRPTGTLALGTDAAPSWTAASADQMDRLGIPYLRLESPDLKARYPWLKCNEGDWGFHLESGGVLLAGRIVAALVKHLEEAGVELRQMARVAEVGKSAVLESGGAVEGDRIVVAAGPWVARLVPSLAERVTPSRQVVTYLQPPPSLQETWAGAPMLLDVGASGFYAVPPVADTPLKVGDHRFSRMGDPDRYREPDEPELEAVAHLARDRFRDFDSYRIVGGRSCFYAVEPDERFVVEEAAGCLVAGGFSGHGFKFGALVGRRIVDHLEGKVSAAALGDWAAGRT